LTETDTETQTNTPTETQTYTVTETGTHSPTPTETFTWTYSSTYTQTLTRTTTSTITNTYTNTPTYTITPTISYTPTSSGENRIEITIYDNNGFEVIKLSESYSQIIVHNINFSQNPYHANGVNVLYIRNDIGQVIGTWNGKNKNGDMARIGTYVVQVKTFDRNNNEYVIQKVLDLVVDLYGEIGVKVYYAEANVRIFGTAKDIEWVKIKIYNIAGELIKTFNPVVSGGSVDVTWDLKTTSGNNAGRGIYILAIEYKDKNTGIILKKFEKLAVR